MLLSEGRVALAHARVEAGLDRLRSDAKKPRRKIPGKAERRRASPALPVQAERDLARAFVALASKLGKRWRSIFLPIAKKVGREHVAERTDAGLVDERGPTKADKAEAAAARARAESAAAEAFSKAAVKRETERAARRVESHSKDQFRKLGVSVEKEPVLKTLVSGWTRDVAERVQGLTDHEARVLEDILLSGHSRFADTLAREIEGRLGVLQGRAEFIARDAVGTINSKITQERFRAAEIEFYVWTTMSDDRVREEHAALDGEVFEVDGPGAEDEGHPGEPPNCRCVAFPLPREEAPKDEDEPAADDEEPKDEDPKDDDEPAKDEETDA